LYNGNSFDIDFAAYITRRDDANRDPPALQGAGKAAERRTLEFA
jgi:hypothetical protein